MEAVALILMAGVIAALIVLVRRGSPRKSATADRTATGPWLLIVDDDPACRDTLALQLSIAGWHARAVASAEDALTVLDRSRPLPNLIVSDVVMPGLDGWGLAAEVRRRYPEIPVLFISGLEDVRPQESRLLPDHVPFLSKPIDRKDLLAAVNSLTLGSNIQTSPPTAA